MGFLFKDILEKIERKIHKILLIIKGRRIFKEHNLSTENCVYFIKGQHVGDVVRGLPVITLFRHYHKLDQDKKFITLSPENTAGLMQMNLDVDEAVIMTMQELKVINRYRIHDQKHVRIYKDAPSPPEIFPVYHIPDEYAQEHPELWMIPKNLGTDSVKTAESLLLEMGLDPLKTLLLVPYARSTTQLELDRFKPVVDLYKKAGYRILLNAFESQETLDGTEAVNWYADVMLAAVQKGFMVIGVQSGFMDACEWMDLTKRIIKIYLLYTEKDYYFFGNRDGDVNKKIEKKDYGYTIAVSSQEDMEKLGDDIIDLSIRINPDLKCL